MVIISACLLGVNCRYDGSSRKLDDSLISCLGHEKLIPLCPEQLGGLTTPRPPCRIIKGGGSDIIGGRSRVLDSFDRDVTNFFIRGAEEVLNIAFFFNVKAAILKEGSPSCGVMRIDKDGRACAGKGVTTALMNVNGIITISSERIPEDYVRHNNHRE